MTPEAQRIAIAEACGWKFNHQRKTAIAPGIDCVEVEPGYAPDYPQPWESFGNYDAVPDYLNDLNAMHEAEKASILRRDKYYGHLILVTGGEWWPLIHATAAKRAEAFLKTIGKWES